MAKQPLNDLYLRTRMFAPAEMATEAHVWRRACSAIDGKSGVLTVIGQLLLALGFGRVRTVASALSNTPRYSPSGRCPPLRLGNRKLAPQAFPDGFGHQ
jgi:hypothetical protein